MGRIYQVAGLVLFALALWIGTESIELRYYTPLGPGPGFFPFWLAVGLGLLAIAMVFEARVSIGDPVPDDFFADSAGYVRMAVVVVAVAGSAFLLERLGFRLTMLAMCLFLLFSLSQNTPVLNLAVAAAASFGAYYVFVRWLAVPLPRGAFGL